MEEKHSHIDELILDYICGASSEEDAIELRQWTAISEQNMNYFNSFLEMWFASGAEANAGKRFDSSRAFERFKADKFTKRTGKNLLYKLLSAAAIIVLVAFLSFKGGQRTITGGFSDIVVEAPKGSMASITLPDKSKVWLNAGSKVSYNQGFGVSDRRLKLSGECYFEVRKNEDLPFIVSNDDLEVEVIGTKFNFRDYPNDLEAIVSLVEGRVTMTNMLRGSNKEKILNPDQRAVLNKHNGQMKIESRNALNSIQWINGTLFFDEELLTDIAKELERNYNVKISIVGNGAKLMRVFGSFRPKETSLKQLLDILSSTNKISYSINGDDITIYGMGD